VVPSPQVDTTARVVGVDDPGQCHFVGFWTDVGVGGPDQLVAGDAMAGGGHAPRPRLMASASTAASRAFSSSHRSPVRSW